VERERVLTFAGWLMAQSLCNRAPLQVSLPPLLFRWILTADDPELPSPTLPLLEEFDPDAARYLRAVENMSQNEYTALCEIEELPATTSRDEYVRAAAARLMYGDGDESVTWQLKAIAEGFQRAMPLEAVRAFGLSATQLASVICGEPGGAAAGTDSYAIRTSFRLALSDGFKEVPPLAAALTKLLDGWPVAAKRKLVKFATGSERLPPPGTEVLAVQLLDESAMGGGAATLGMLPQAHTCDNLLELPNYWEGVCESNGLPTLVAEGLAFSDPYRFAALTSELEKVLDGRLHTAVHECEAYSLDETRTGASATARPRQRSCTTSGGGASCTAATSSTSTANLNAGARSRATAATGGAVGHMSSSSMLSVGLEEPSVKQPPARIAVYETPPPAPPALAPAVTEELDDEIDELDALLGEVSPLSSPQQHTIEGNKHAQQPRQLSRAVFGLGLELSTEPVAQASQLESVDDLITELEVGAVGDDTPPREATSAGGARGGGRGQAEATAAHMSTGCRVHNRGGGADLDYDLELELLDFNL